MADNKTIPFNLSTLEALLLINQLTQNRQYRRAVELAILLIRSDPHDRKFQQTFIDIYVKQIAREQLTAEQALSSVTAAMQFGHLPENLTSIYFESLKKTLPITTEPKSLGQLVIGLGPGRCGSTTLSTILSTAQDSVVTHEAPPMVTLPATKQQIAFHSQRFSLLLNHYSFVADVSHWWAYHSELLIKLFPNIKFLVMHREMNEIVNSFIRVKSSHPPGENHWEAHEGSYWSKSIWDFAYPKFSFKNESQVSPEKRREFQLRAYVRDYYQRCQKIPDNNCMHINLKNLDATSIEEISRFIETPLVTNAHWKNKNSYTDSLAMNFKANP